MVWLGRSPSGGSGLNRWLEVTTGMACGSPPPGLAEAWHLSPCPGSLRGIWQSLTPAFEVVLVCLTNASDLPQSHTEEPLQSFHPFSNINTT